MTVHEFITALKVLGGREQKIQDFLQSGNYDAISSTRVIKYRNNTLVSLEWANYSEGCAKVRVKYHGDIILLIRPTKVKDAFTIVLETIAELD